MIYTFHPISVRGCDWSKYRETKRPYHKQMRKEFLKIIFTNDALNNMQNAIYHLQPTAVIYKVITTLQTEYIVGNKTIIKADV